MYEVMHYPYMDVCFDCDHFLDTKNVSESESCWSHHICTVLDAQNHCRYAYIEFCEISCNFVCNAFRLKKEKKSILNRFEILDIR